MSARCYILFSRKLNKFYVGVTNEDVQARITKHNESKYGSHRYTSTANDWTLFLEVALYDFAHAMRLETKIKSMKSAKYILNLKKYPELIQKIIEETRASDS